MPVRAITSGSRAGAEVVAHLRPRAAAMAERLALTAERAGIDEEGARKILASYDLAMQTRDREIEDEHQIDYLHPGRTALILMEDLGFRGGTEIAAGVLVESLHENLRVSARCMAELDSDIVALTEIVPTPIEAGELLLEELLASDQVVRTIALAEWLDQARRLHLRGREYWEEQYRLTNEVYLPIAGMTDQTLSRRFRWWSRTFGERLG